MFDTIDISNPRFEEPGLREITVKSPALRGRGDISVYIPPGAENLRDLPVVILLHGVYGSHWAWIRQMGVHLTCNKLVTEGVMPPAVLLMPSDGLPGDGSAYIPHEGADYESWIVRDVIGAAIEVLDQVSSHSRCFITGLSMGGYGALRLGAKYCDLFQAFSGHSSITALGQMKEFVHGNEMTYQVEGEDDGTVLFWMDKNASKMGPMRFDCGRDDLLIGYNRELHTALEARGIDHIYEEFDGGHSHDYWGKHITRTFTFFAASMD